MFTIGCHLSIAKGFNQAAQEASSIDANTFQFFTRNPRGGKAKELSDKDLAAFYETCKHGEIGCMLAHAPYTLNPASPNENTRDFALMTLAEDLARMEIIMAGQCYNMHPGSHTTQSEEAGIQSIIDALNSVLCPEQSTTLLLETMAGKGSEIGGTFEQLAQIIDGVKLNDHVGVCVDTCHIYDAGYDIVNDLDGVLEHFDSVVGLERIKAVHLNDSKFGLASHKDRHAAIGEGQIGAEAFGRIINHPALRDLPFYLETPHDAISEYGDEIALLKSLKK